MSRTDKSIETGSILPRAFRDRGFKGNSELFLKEKGVCGDAKVS